jgi:hypothetical protein
MLVCAGFAAPGRLGAEDLVVGMSAAFTGPSRGLGIELYRGSQAYFESVNAHGGVHGRASAPPGFLGRRPHKRPYSVDGQRADEMLAQPIGHGREPHAVFLLQLGQPPQLLVGRRACFLGHRTAPQDAISFRLIPMLQIRACRRQVLSSKTAR